MKLYGSFTSPYARKLRVLIIEKQLPVEFVFANPTAADSVVPTLNPLGLVPVLVRDDGSVLFDSPVIAEYLDSLTSPALIPKAGEERWQVLRWAALADGILDVTVDRTLEARRPESQRLAATLTRHEAKIARAMDFAERELMDGPWLVANRLTLADIALATALGYVDFRYPHDWKTGHPRLAGWYAAVGARPAFVETRPPQ